jgi:hypothetical protein
VATIDPAYLPNLLIWVWLFWNDAPENGV